ncbi:hypothetical protein D3C75_1382480 [compost metagenome]
MRFADPLLQTFERVGGLQNHPLDQVDSKHFLRYAVLNLKSRVYFEEVILPGIRVI